MTIRRSRSCARCGATTPSARHTYCPDCAWLAYCESERRRGRVPTWSAYQAKKATRPDPKRYGPATRRPAANGRPRSTAARSPAHGAAGSSARASRGT